MYEPGNNILQITSRNLKQNDLIKFTLMNGPFIVKDLGSLTLNSNTLHQHTWEAPLEVEYGSHMAKNLYTIQATVMRGELPVHSTRSRTFTINTLTSILPNSTVSNNGLACGLNNGSNSDGLSVNLSAKGSNLLNIDGKEVTSCVDFNFSDSSNLLKIKYSSLGSACGVNCVGQYCGTGGNLYIYYYSNNKWNFLSELTRSTVWKENIIRIPSSTNRILACRTGAGIARDNVGIDFLRLYK